MTRGSAQGHFIFFSLAELTPGQAYTGGYRQARARGGEENRGEEW